MEEDDGDAVAVDGGVEHARLHHVERLSEDGGGGAGQAGSRQVCRPVVDFEHRKNEGRLENVVESNLSGRRRFGIKANGRGTSIQRHRIKEALMTTVESTRFQRDFFNGLSSQNDSQKPAIPIGPKQPGPAVLRHCDNFIVESIQIRSTMYP